MIFLWVKNGETFSTTGRPLARTILSLLERSGLAIFIQSCGPSFAIVNVYKNLSSTNIQKRKEQAWNKN